jgi:hypothetical protein
MGVLEDQESGQRVRAAIKENPSNAIDYIHVIARRVIVWAAIVGTAFLAAVGIYPITRALLENDGWVSAVIQKHFAAIVGLPAAAALAFLIVITFEARFDAIEMEFFGIVKFKGASGPIVLWVFCFLTMACCIRMLW